MKKWYVEAELIIEVVATSAWSKLSDHLHVMHVRDPNASDKST